MLGHPFAPVAAGLRVGQRLGREEDIGFDAFVLVVIPLFVFSNARLGRTAGAALPSMIEKLPNGDGFQYAIANYISKGGAALEGGGVTPDVEIPHSREALLAGDAVLDAAIQWIDEQSE